MKHFNFYQKQVQPQTKDINQNKVRKQLFERRFKIFDKIKVYEGSDLNSINNQNEEILSDEKNCCCIEPFELASGGSGQVLYLSMIRIMAIIFLLLTLGAAPIQYELIYLRINQDQYPHIAPQSSKALLYLDLLSYGAIYQQVSFDKYTFYAGDNEIVKNWRSIFLYSNVTNIIIFLIGVLIWFYYCEYIIEKVDSNTKTPSDQTLEVQNLPSNADEHEIKKIVCDIFPDEILDSRVNVAKSSDQRVDSFVRLNEAARKLRNARTVEWRKLKKQQPNKNNAELVGEIMADRFKGQLKYVDLVTEFDKASQECQNIDKTQNGFDIKKVENIYAFATFKHESATCDILDQQQEALQCRCCKDICCIEYPKNLSQSQNGQTSRLYLRRAQNEPGDINWENLGVGVCSTLIRRIIFVIIILISCSITISGLWYGYNQANGLGIPKAGCNAVMNLQVRKNVNNLSPTNVLIEDINVEGLLGQQEDCSANINCNNQSEYQQESDNNSNLKQCICESQINDQYNQTQYSRVCSGELNIQLQYTQITFGLTIFTIFMNMITYILIISSVSINRPVSKTEDQAIKVFWVFIAHFNNMVIIPMFIKTQQEIDFEWYQSVGTSIMTNFIMQIFAPNIQKLIEPIFNIFNFYQPEDIAQVTVDEEKFCEQVAGPDPLDSIWLRYSQIMSFVSCCFVFGLNYPVLQPIAFIGLLIMYQVEKQSLLQIQRKVDFSSYLNYYSNNIQIWMIILHAIWGLWVWSNPYFFISDSEIETAYTSSAELQEFSNSNAQNTTSFFNKFTLNSDDYDLKSLDIRKRIPFIIILQALLIVKIIYNLSLFIKLIMGLIKDTKLNKKIEYFDEYNINNIDSVIKSQNIKENVNLENIYKLITLKPQINKFRIIRSKSFSIDKIKTDNQDQTLASKSTLKLKLKNEVGISQQNSEIYRDTDENQSFQFGDWLRVQCSGHFYHHVIQMGNGMVLERNSINHRYMGLQGESGNGVQLAPIPEAQIGTKGFKIQKKFSSFITDEWRDIIKKRIDKVLNDISGENRPNRYLGYNIINKNCEHFCSYIQQGYEKSNQRREVLQGLIAKGNIINVLGNYIFKPESWKNF